MLPPDATDLPECRHSLKARVSVIWAEPAAMRQIYSPCYGGATLAEAAEKQLVTVIIAVSRPPVPSVWSCARASAAAAAAGVSEYLLAYASRKSGDVLRRQGARRRSPAIQ